MEVTLGLLGIACIMLAAFWLSPIFGMFILGVILLTLSFMVFAISES